VNQDRWRDAAEDFPPADDRDWSRDREDMVDAFDAAVPFFERGQQALICPPKALERGWRIEQGPAGLLADRPDLVE
jgi:hypothetical protein